MLKDLPIIELTPQQQEKLRRETWALCVQDGRAARRLGVPLRSCPPFRDPDMQVSWRMGWHYEDKDIREAKRAKAVRRDL